MVFKSRIWISTALALMLSLLFWFYFGVRVEAASSGPYSVTYEGVDFYFYKGNFNLSCKSNNYNVSSFSFTFDDPDNTVTFFYKSSSSISFFIWHTGDVVSGGICKVMYTNGEYYTQELTNGMSSGFSNTYFDYAINESSFVKYGDFGLSASAYRNLAKQFVASDEYANVRMPIEAIWAKGESDNSFSLRFVQGLVEEDVFHAYWGFPAREDLEGYENLPLRVRFYVEDIDTGEVINFYYPKVLESIMKPTKALYSVNDLELHIPISDLGELPANYCIQYVELYPYYFVDDIVLQENLRKGTKSVIKLNYDGTYKSTIEVSPDDVYDEENTDNSIMGMISNFFSGFFNNLLDALKRAFIPSSDDLWSLLNDMNDWFSVRLGFIWYPFDLAFRIVEAFSLGESNNIIKVPAMHLNMLGGITLYEGGEFEIDSVGVFDYIKFFTSAIMACSVVSLAKVKWDEWIGGRKG